MSKINYKKISTFVISFVFVFLLPIFCIYADLPAPPVGSTPTIQNPLGANNMQVETLLGRIMNLVSMVGGLVVVFFIIYSGYKFVVAGSSDTDRTKAKEIFFYTIIGGAILLGADIIANIVVNTVKCTTKGIC
jgi:hypothetical protein